jgi:hypothetical protein
LEYLPWEIAAARKFSEEDAVLESFVWLAAIPLSFVTICFFVVLGTYPHYRGEPPPKIERLIERIVVIAEEGAHSVFSRLRRAPAVIDRRPDKAEPPVIDVIPDTIKKLERDR